MPWVEFRAAFNWAPPVFGRRWSITYPKGDIRLVPTPCARAAIAAGKAALTDKRPRGHRHHKGNS